MKKTECIRLDAAALPSTWVTTTLGNVTFPRGVKVKPSELADAPFIGLKDIEAHTLRLLGVGQARDVKSSGSYFDRGDVLYGRLRPYLNKVYQPDFSGMASGEFIVFPSQSHLDNAYLMYFLNQLEFASFATRLNAGDRPRVDFGQLEEYPLPLAPILEQRRIVEEIEKQFTRLDAAETALKRVQANLKRYRASVLKAACEGKLVPTEAELAQAEGRDYERGDQLLERILSERRARWASQGKRRGKDKEPVSPDTSDLPELPEGWVWASVEMLTQNFDRHRVPVKAKDRAKLRGPYPYYGASGMIDVINDYLFDGTFLLIAEDGANLLARTTPIAFVVSGQFWVNNHAHVVKTFGTMPMQYLGIYLNSLNVERYVTGTAQPKLTQTALNHIPVPIPPLADQVRIVAEVERRLSIIQKAESTVEASLKRIERLRQSILKQAFCGQLVSQDPNDEPASVLLQRIRAERVAAQAATSTRRKTRGGRAKSAADKQLPLLESDS